jgi:hypothetical protein
VGGAQNVYRQIVALPLTIDQPVDPFQAWVEVNPDRADADDNEQQHCRQEYH